MKLRSLVKQFRIDKPERFRLADHNPAETAGFEKGEAKEIARAQSERMTHLQQRLYAAHSWALLIVLQGVDAAGKGQRHHARDDVPQPARLHRSPVQAAHL